MVNLATFAKRLREARQKAGLTQAELAKKADTTAATVSSYESTGTIKKASLDLAISFAEALGVSLDWLCGLDLGGAGQKEVEDKKKFEAIKTFLDITDCQIFYSQYDRSGGFVKIDVTDIGVSYYIQEYKRICDVIDNITGEDMKEKARNLFVEDFDKNFTSQLYFYDGNKIAFKPELKKELYENSENGTICVGKALDINDLVDDIPF